MGDVVPLRQEFEERLSGHGLCLSCRHEWAAVAPVGTDVLECPDCGLEKGVFAGLVAFPDEELWRCRCGGFVLFATPGGVYCLLCGRRQVF